MSISRSVGPCSMPWTRKQPSTPREWGWQLSPANFVLKKDKTTVELKARLDFAATVRIRFWPIPPTDGLIGFRQA